MGSGTKPILKALLVADHVYKDVNSGKMIVCGIFHQMVVSTTAADPVDYAKVKAGFSVGSPFAYFSVTDADGDHTFDLRYVDLATDEVHIQVEIKTSCADPLQTLDVAVPLPPLPHRVGVYALELLWNTYDPMGSFRISVGEMK